MTAEGLRPWEALNAGEQLALRQAFDRWQADLPPTCNLLTKAQRFADWLREQGVHWQPPGR